MILRRIRAHKFLCVSITVPVVSVGGLAVYVEYRRRTRPVLPVFVPVVNENGSLLLDGKVVPRPSFWAVAWRVVQLLYIFFPLAVLYVVMRLRREWYLLWLERLLYAVESAGPAFVKAGQWSCTRQDVFSPEFRSVFKKLYDGVDTHPYKVSLQILKEELQQDPDEIFTDIEEETVGSGSIGQVHGATLRSTGERVVVKVMHPYVVETVVKDFFIINSLASLLHKYVPSLERYDLPALGLAWTTHLAAQLDFRVEARNLDLFRENFKNEPFVSFPKPLFSTQRVLVETFCKGEPASVEFLAAQEEHARDKLAHCGLNTWCKMLLHDRFLHGDMHPGNVLVDVSDPHEPCVSLIDAGLCQQISEEESIATHNLMESFVHWKADLCSEALLNMGAHQRYANKEKFRSEIRWLFDHWRPLHSKNVVVTNILQAVFECIRKNEVHMDPPYVSLLFAVLVLESFIMNLNPDFNMVRHAAPWLISDGHLTRGLVKNIAMTSLDLMKQELGVLRGRLRDGVHKELVAKDSVYVGTGAW
uniref:Protein kinase domain-containing protein n=1 Tax=Trypanosoma congolense (strain IL3000) TaxID=1068625 RepID=G0UX60_TRYCI|nr:conserved hypothetical protein [Trypanosoma congolense IL3000]